MNKKYNEKSIEKKKDLEHIRLRPGMYIGSVDSRGLNHLLWEIIDNSVDEALNGFGDTITIELNTDDSITVSDLGRGIPVGMHDSGKNTLEMILTELNTGGKFSENGGYNSSGGLHGVGSTAVNALSEYLKVEVCRDKKKHEIEFIDGGKLKTPCHEIGTTNKTGTKTTFKPDSNIFSTTIFNYKLVCERCQEKAFLLKNVKFIVINHFTNEINEYKYEDSLLSFMQYLHIDKKVLHDTVYFEADKENIKVAVAFQYTDSYQENLYSFVNLIRTKDGGTHEIGFKSSFTKVINEYARNNGFLKDKDTNFDGSDIREGLTAIISLTIPEDLLQFESQTKEKLGTPLAKTVVSNIVEEKLGYFLNENKSLSSELISKIKKAYEVRVAVRKAKEQARLGKKNTNKTKEILSGKLANAQSKDVKKLELFLVEGDSAGGSAKKCRDSKFQAILPLRGKVLNTEKASVGDIEKNEELNTIIHCIGAGVGNSFNIDDINYDKIIIMTDADTDGAHIQVLLLTFFYRFMRQLIEKGHVYIARPPLYQVKYNGQKVYCYSDEELNQIKKDKNKLEIQRYKGLGEMDFNQLWDTTMNPETRTLIQVNIDDIITCERHITTLMGNNAELRRKWIDENINFSLQDDFKVVLND